MTAPRLASGVTLTGDHQTGRVGSTKRDAARHLYLVTGGKWRANSRITIGLHPSSFNFLRLRPNQGYAKLTLYLRQPYSAIG